MAKKLSTYPGYDENVDSGIANIFATAAFRFAHGMIQPFIFRFDENYKNHPTYPTQVLHKSMFTPWRVIFEGKTLNFLTHREAVTKTIKSNWLHVVCRWDRPNPEGLAGFQG